MKKELVLQSVQSSVSSIFSKEDVINLINSIQGEGRVITVTEIGAAIDRLIDSLERDVQQVVDLGSVEFTLNYDNRIEVESVNLDFDFIREALENTFMDLGEADDE